MRVYRIPSRDFLVICGLYFRRYFFAPLCLYVAQNARTWAYDCCTIVISSFVLQTSKRAVTVLWLSHTCQNVYKLVTHSQAEQHQCLWQTRDCGRCLKAASDESWFEGSSNCGTIIVATGITQKSTRSGKIAMLPLHIYICVMPKNVLPSRGRWWRVGKLRFKQY
jgi:hypothetical protein